MARLPFLSPAEFETAGRELCARAQRVGFEAALCHADGLGYRYLKIVQRRPGQGGLRGGADGVTGVGKSGPAEGEYEEGDEEEMDGEGEDEDEDEMAFHHERDPRQPVTVEYSVLLSPTYRVPVLYVHLCNLPPAGPVGVDAAYRYLVPQQARSELSTVGVMGGLSMTNHPVTDIPCYFIHPCMTAEAMQEIIGRRQVSPWEYLLLWMGLLGGCVGLYLPKELALEAK